MAGSVSFTAASPSVVAVDRYHHDTRGIQLGMYVVSTTHGPGVVRHVGPVAFSSGVWVGLELEQPLGKHDGSVSGKRYFTCRRHHGIFVRPVDVDPASVRNARESHMSENEVSQLLYSGSVEHGTNSPSRYRGGRRAGRSRSRGRQGLSGNSSFGGSPERKQSAPTSSRFVASGGSAGEYVSPVHNSGDGDGLPPHESASGDLEQFLAAKFGKRPTPAHSTSGGAGPRSDHGSSRVNGAARGTSRSSRGAKVVSEGESVSLVGYLPNASGASFTRQPVEVQGTVRYVGQLRAVSQLRPWAVVAVELDGSLPRNLPADFFTAPSLASTSTSTSTSMAGSDSSGDSDGGDDDMDGGPSVSNGVLFMGDSDEDDNGGVDGKGGGSVVKPPTHMTSTTVALAQHDELVEQLRKSVRSLDGALSKLDGVAHSPPKVISVAKRFLRQCSHSVDTIGGLSDTQGLDEGVVHDLALAREMLIHAIDDIAESYQEFEAVVAATPKPFVGLADRHRSFGRLRTKVEALVKVAGPPLRHTLVWALEQEVEFLKAAHNADAASTTAPRSVFDDAGDANRPLAAAVADVQQGIFALVCAKHDPDAVASAAEAVVTAGDSLVGLLVEHNSATADDPTVVAHVREALAIFSDASDAVFDATGDSAATSYVSDELQAVLHEASLYVQDALSYVLESVSRKS